MVFSFDGRWTRSWGCCRGWARWGSRRRDLPQHLLHLQGNPHSCGFTQLDPRARVLRPDLQGRPCGSHDGSGLQHVGGQARLGEELGVCVGGGGKTACPRSARERQLLPEVCGCLACATQRCSLADGFNVWPALADIGDWRSLLGPTDGHGSTTADGVGPDWSGYGPS